MQNDILFAAQVYGLGFIISLFMAAMIKLLLKGIRIFMKSN